MYICFLRQYIETDQNLLSLNYMQTIHACVSHRLQDQRICTPNSCQNNKSLSSSAKLQTFTFCRETEQIINENTTIRVLIYRPLRKDFYNNSPVTKCGTYLNKSDTIGHVQKKVRFLAKA